MKKIICKIIGHDVSAIDLIVALIKANALNNPELKTKPVICMRCGINLTELYEEK